MECSSSEIREAMEKSMTESSQTFEEDIARLIREEVIERKEGLAQADSPTNLMWRLENDFSRKVKESEVADDSDDGPSFTDITLDVKQ